MEPDDDWDADIPSADATIKPRYEQALGSFLVAFNRVENLLSDLLARDLTKANKPVLLTALKGQQLHSKLQALELLAIGNSFLQRIPFEEIRRLASERNHLAHGHFDQNPFSGDYSIVSAKRETQHQADELDRLSKRACDVWWTLRGVEACYIFDGVVPVLPIGASATPVE